MSPATLEAALIRVAIWRVLAQVFDVPNPAWRERLREVARELHDACPDPAYALREPLGGLIANLEDLDPAVLEMEYHLLFATQMLVTPYESSYHRTGRGAVIGDVTAFYTAFGLQLKPETGAADSMRNELAFLAWLAIKEAHAIERQLAEPLDVTRKATRDFLADHIGRWAPAFVERLIGVTATPFYHDAANLLIAALNAATSEFAVRDVKPLDADDAPIEPDVMPCPAAGACAGAEQT